MKRRDEGGQNLLATGAVIVALLWVAACDLSTRAPEPPTGNEGRLVTLSDPDSVLLQMQVGLTSGFINSYMNAFTPDFVFHPDEADSFELAQSNPGVFDDWTSSVEQQVMQVVINSYPQRNVTFTNVDSTVIIPGSVVVLDEDYDLVVNSDRYEGRAELQMSLVAGEWRCFTWIDRRRSGSTERSWSYLKGQNR